MSVQLKWAVWGCVLSLPWQALAQDLTTDTVRPGTVIYKISANATQSDLKGLNALLKSHGLVSERTLDGSQIVIATFEHHGREKAIAKILDKSGYVEFAEPDFALEPTLAPDDPLLSYQWHHNSVNSRQAWDLTTGNSSVLVAVCDTGFDVNHPDLEPNLRIDLAFNAQDGTDYIFDANGHGTGSAGTLGAVGNNSIGVVGANWDVDIIPVRIAISDQNSSAYISTMATCIEYAANNGARVVNLSYGGIQYSTIDAAAQYLRARNGLLFMSAGNSGEEHAGYPDYVSLVGVGATDRNDAKASFSSWGAYVDVTAPGVDIATTYPDNQYVYYSGTSFSSPLTAGIAALMVAANPTITPDEIENGLFSTAVDIGAVGDDNVFGHGLVDAFAAVSYAQNLGNFSPPVANLVVSSNSVSFGTVISFDATGSSDSDGSITSYHWNFGDGSSSNNSMESHTYSAAGSYQVSLTVTDNDGLSDSETTTIQVTNALPTPVISITGSQSSYAVNELVSFVGAGSSDSDGYITSYEWDFGNGDGSDLIDVDYSYPSAGNYIVTLTVTDNAGASNSSNVTVSVIDPYVLVAPSNLAATVDGLQVTLTWQDNSLSETNYIVERGGKRRGKVTFEPIATLDMNTTSYAETVEPGDYTYRVTVINVSQQLSSDTLKVTVDSAANPDPGSVAAPSNLQLSSSGNQVTLTWTDNANAERFEVERGVKAKGQFDFAKIADAASSTYIDSSFGDLQSGNYGYRVKAFKGTGESNYSNIVEIRKK
ncbi:serine protease [Vibrio galatheae]|uniref:Serine protease n=1 Tax=Vibrio galatheae TaxID=579748 RepID=A0A0F4NQJ9_9VIBR|nr:serine protease [Vibrio galatheae]